MVGRAAPARTRRITAQTILLVFQLAHAVRRKIKNRVETLALGGQHPRRRIHTDAAPNHWAAGHLPVA
ncbi:hypothetical protein [Streptomyces albidus (ex Kaewkla and Franco 2022)]|uniref:hypothetical protein n=1 Tax=Streptomyces albidus (ex Kaewkla and Franco 2022) TaxID=722709 RepID=UPI0015EFC0C5|nr:hypothetical protein [Streptomyces albidus (ex Kaewkla and Franco 2022)]